MLVIQANPNLTAAQVVQVIGHVDIHDDIFVPGMAREIVLDIFDHCFRTEHQDLLGRVMDNLLFLPVDDGLDFSRTLGIHAVEDDVSLG